jgi:DNA-binding MarR family transcriptional regulator
MLFKDCICFQLGKITRKITKHYRDKIALFGLTHGQFFMLVAILEEEGMLPSQLAEKTAQDRATTTGLIDRLERDGWIERHPDPNDRRALHIRLSPKALKHRQAILSIFEETNQQFLKRFSPNEWAQFLSFLQKLD